MVKQNLAQKVNKMKVNIKTCNIIYDMSNNLNLKGHDTSKLYIEQNLKIMILYKFNITFLYHTLNIIFFANNIAVLVSFSKIVKYP